MTWVYLALAIFVACCFFAHALKFKMTMVYCSPKAFVFTAGVSFYWIHWEFSGPGGSRPVSTGTPNSLVAQRGFVSVPVSWQFRIKSIQKHLRLVLLKFALDPKVWRILFIYLTKTGRRTFRLLHLRLESMHIGMEDVLSLGKIAAVWSSLSVLFLPLRCPIEYAFNEKPGSLKINLTGGFSGLQALAFAGSTVFTFPWVSLGHRFFTSWRNPRLNRWQRRLLLF